jgi:hypothetical protein
MKISQVIASDTECHFSTENAKEIFSEYQRVDHSWASCEYVFQSHDIVDQPICHEIPSTSRYSSELRNHILKAKKVMWVNGFLILTVHFRDKRSYRHNFYDFPFCPSTQCELHDDGSVYRWPFSKTDIFTSHVKTVPSLKTDHNVHNRHGRNGRRDTFPGIPSSKTGFRRQTE